jgi:hypothetical protein
MPQELWRVVVGNLPSLIGRHTAEVFGFGIEERHQKHSDVWNEIFVRDEGWCLNFILIGDDLHNLLNDLKQPAYIALLTGDSGTTLSTASEADRDHRNATHTGPQHGSAIDAGLLASRSSELSSSNDDGGSSDSEADPSSYNNGYSSKDKYTRMNGKRDGLG